MNTFINVYCNHGTQRFYSKIQNYLSTHKKQKMPIIIGTFFILSIIGTLILAMIGQGYLRFGDFSFHYDRLLELHHDLVNHIRPSFNQSVGNPQGIATNVFYPWLTWLPFTLLTFMTPKPLNVFYLSFIIIVFMRFLISFFSYRTYDSNKFHGFVFAFLYTTNASVFYWLFLSEDIGASLATDFLPLVLFGFLAYLRKDRWRMLTIGLVLAFYSHLVTALLAVVFVALLFVMNISKLTWHKLLNMSVAILVSVLLTAPQLTSMVKIVSHNYIMTPGANGVEFGQGLFTQLGVSIPIIAILITFSKHWKLSYFDKQLLVIGAFCFFVNAHLVGDMFAMAFPLVRHLQFSVRFCVIEYLVFPFLIMEYMRNWSRDQTVREHQSFMKFTIMIILIIMPCVANFNSAKQVRSYQPVNHQFTTSLVKHIGTGKFHATFLKNKINDRELQRMPGRAYYMDYAPITSTWQWQNFVDDRPNVYANHKFRMTEQAKVNSTPRGITVSSHKNLRDVQLPLVIYHGIKYHILINGKIMTHSQIDSSLTNRNQLLTLKQLPRGETQVSLS